MNKINKIINLALVSFFIYFLWQMGLRYYSSYQIKGISVESSEVLNKNIDYKKYQDKKHILVFWATWCPPCKLELKRINRLILKGSIDKNKILAVNMGESSKKVNKHIKDNDYHFLSTIDLGEMAHKLKITSTPTIVFIKKNFEVDNKIVGISPLLEFRLKSFLKE